MSSATSVYTLIATLLSCTSVSESGRGIVVILAPRTMEQTPNAPSATTSNATTARLSRDQPTSHIAASRIRTTHTSKTMRMRRQGVMRRLGIRRELKRRGGPRRTTKQEAQRLGWIRLLQIRKTFGGGQSWVETLVFWIMDMHASVSEPVWILVMLEYIRLYCASRTSSPSCSNFVDKLSRSFLMNGYFTSPHITSPDLRNPSDVLFWGHLDIADGTGQPSYLVGELDFWSKGFMRWCSVLLTSLLSL